MSMRRRASPPSRQRSIDSEFDLGALRTSLDEQSERSRNEFSAINKRIDWLEKLVYSRDATRLGPTGAAGAAPKLAIRPRLVRAARRERCRRRDRRQGRRSVDVTPGFMVPDLGRVAARAGGGG